MTERGDLGDYAHGQFAVDYETRVDHAALRADRVERVRSTMSEAGLDALLVWKDENVRFLSGLRAQIIQGKSALLNGCLLTAAGDMVLFLSGGEVDRARNVMTWIDEIHAIPIMEARGLIAGAFDNVIAPVFHKLDLDSARLGLDELAFAQIDEFGRVLPEVNLADGDAVMQRVRLVKTPADIALMQEAAAIGDAVTQSAIAAVRPGVRETDVVAEAMHTLYRLGGEMAHVATPFVASGEHMSPPNRFASDKIIREGDLVFIDIGAQYNGHYADVGRTVICGSPSRRQQEIYTAVYYALHAGVAAMKPGATNDDVAEAVTVRGRDRGFGDNFFSLFIGHGVGMGSNEPPYIGEALPGADTVVLTEGMTMAVEPLIWVPDVRGGGGVRLEDTITVGPGGGIPLTRTAFDDRLLLD
ncbi:MAG: M24 family metallopeptidase [Actinobacteria bacterium]|nr:M24 family metallopeptidase [Actinomycetota bacterium]